MKDKDFGRGFPKFTTPTSRRSFISLPWLPIHNRIPESSRLLSQTRYDPRRSMPYHSDHAQTKCTSARRASKTGRRRVGLVRAKRARSSLGEPAWLRESELDRCALLGTG